MKNRNVFKRIAICGMAAALAFCASGCVDGNDPNPDDPNPNKPTKLYNNENDPLTFSIQEVDGVFSPYFATTGPDMEVVGMTQIGMLGNTYDGKPAYGKDEAVVALDFQEVTEGTIQDVDQFTTYSFVLKNDVRFSDGVPLTIKDVLFNLYLYLDPAYYGSSTIYSTEIVGLQEYRTQEPDELESEQNSAELRFQNEAAARIDALRQAYSDIYDLYGNRDELTEEQFEKEFKAYAAANKNNPDQDMSHLEEDYAKAIEYFNEELNSDYSSSVDSYQDIKFNSRNNPNLGYQPFTTDVEAFLYNEGFISWNASGNGGDGELTSRITNDLASLKSWTKEQAIEEVYLSYIPYSFNEVITYWGTAQKLAEYLASKARQEFFKDGKNVKFTSISGIQFANRRGPVQVNGKTYEVPQYNDDGSVKDGYNEVLTIKIKNVDPKAIWNFSFSIAPMHYYSSAEEIAKFDYVDHFGVKYSDRDFLDDVVNASKKQGVPVGAGPYAASTSAGGIDYNKFDGSDFKQSNIIYFERNPYFTMGDGEGGVAKIKKVRYQVIASAQMTSALYTGEVDFITPNAKPETKDEIKGKTGYDAESIQTNGYGYIGINAGLVPSLKVRQAIMHSINVESVVSYYKGTADIIYRSMSKSSWAYPQGASAYYPWIEGPIPSNINDMNEYSVNPDYKAFVQAKGKKGGEYFSPAEQKEFIIGLVEGAGFKKNSNGIYYNDQYLNTNGSNLLKYKFTIVGSETDHPAFNALLQAGQFLSATIGGFDITTGTDPDGLRKLSTGDLAVWAAAWGSTIDPDMYQVYHKESKATSVNAWGYPAIINGASNGRFAVERGILEELAEYIENGRKTTNEKARVGIYSHALDLVMQLAIELPTYQRDDLYGWNDGKIDSSTFTPAKERSALKGLTSHLWDVSLRVS